MKTTTDRIRLAEAMGWEVVPNPYPSLTYTCWQKDPMGNSCSHIVSDQQLPDPFTDANADYAVLEWIRGKHFVTYLTHYLEHEYTQDYKIGDIARAALKVIE